MAPFSIRPTAEADAPLLPAIERSAGEAFLEIPDLAWIASDRIMSAEEHLPFVQRQASWVAVDAADAPLGFIIADPVGGYMHVWEIAVQRAMQGLGLGSALLAHAVRTAAAQALPGVTLTTFRDVPWNAPFYARCGFRTLGAHELTPALRGFLDKEARAGLPPARRCAMLRDL